MTLTLGHKPMKKNRYKAAFECTKAVTAQRPNVRRQEQVKSDVALWLAAGIEEWPQYPTDNRFLARKSGGKGST